MKITSVDPGHTFLHQGKWAYMYFRNGDPVKVTDDLQLSSNAAKQKMREAVKLLRRRHGLETQSAN